ncbi:phytosulfokines 3-like [Cornus florida]|uniref:phytosulfokines 3-like n=1 Tax=Cornus florida TaxID=4283 RepID=UPI0028969375|nr:phytosulfokines 3-like [Cornus florida]
MSKLNTLFMVALLLFFTLTCAARPEPSLATTQIGVDGAENIEADEACEGMEKEECLMRRTLVAHTDYIYTQEHKP